VNKTVPVQAEENRLSRNRRFPQSPLIDHLSFGQYHAPRDPTGLFDNL
jgi:hypothetical protein